MATKFQLSYLGKSHMISYPFYHYLCITPIAGIDYNLLKALQIAGGDQPDMTDLHMRRGTAGASHSFRDIRAVLLSRADFPEPAAP